MHTLPEFKNAAKTLFSLCSQVLQNSSLGKPTQAIQNSQPSKGNYAVMLLSTGYNDAEDRDYTRYRRTYLFLDSLLTQKMKGVKRVKHSRFTNEVTSFLLHGSAAEGFEYISLGFDPDQVGISVEFGMVTTPDADDKSYFQDMFLNINLRA